MYTFSPIRKENASAIFPIKAIGPTDGRLYHRVMGIRSVLAANLRALMDHAKETGHRELATLEGLEGVSGVGKSAIHRTLKQKTSMTVDNLEALASAYELSAWQLLVPDLSPGNPPHVPVSAVERDLWAGIEKSLAAMRKAEGIVSVKTSRTVPGATGDTSRPGLSKKVKNHR